MFTLADVAHLLAHEFASLGRGSFALMFILSGPFYCLFFWHDESSPCSNKGQGVRLAMGQVTRASRLQFGRESVSFLAGCSRQSFTRPARRIRDICSWSCTASATASKVIAGCQR